MRGENGVQKLDFNSDFMLASAEKRAQSGDLLGALRMLKKRNGMHEPVVEGCLLSADIYEQLGLYPMAVDSWFRFLDTCNEADFDEGYEGLSVSFMNIGNEAMAAIYYHKILLSSNQGEGGFSSAEKAQIGAMFHSDTPQLRLIWSKEGGEDCSEQLNAGVNALKAGDLQGAREKLALVSKESKEYASAMGLSAMCALMQGDAETAQKECEELLREQPNSVQGLTTYCAVLSERKKKEEAKSVATHLASLPVDETDELYKVATAMCETGLHDKAFEKFTVLRERLPYDKNILWFYSASAVKIGKLEEAVDALDLLTTVYPRSAIAEYYLSKIRIQLDGGEPCPDPSYFYKLPQAEYSRIVKTFTRILDGAEEELERYAQSPRLLEYLRLSFDELEGRDDKLQTLGATVAVRCRIDSFLREVLLDYEGNDLVKFYILHELTQRNEENSFGTVICSLYHEFFMHQIEIGRRKYKQFLTAFADVYSKFAMFGEEFERKIVLSAEDVYHFLAETNSYECMEEREALSAVIYREAHLPRGERGIDKICELFGANRAIVTDILDRIL